MLFSPFDDDPPWGGGLQSPDSRFPVGAEVVFNQTISGPTTTGEWVIVVQDEVGTVTRMGSRRILVRMDRRAKAKSLYVQKHLIRRL